MFTRVLLFLSILVCLVGTANTALADVPHLINYQGVLLDALGDPVTTPVNVIFAVWDDPVAGDSLWSEPQAVSPDEDGRFNVLLGAVSPIPDSAFAGAETYLSVKVDTDPEMTPRQRFASVAYAYHAASADAAAYADSTDAITDGGVDFADIGQNGAAENQIIKWDGASWVAADDEPGTGSDNDWTLTGNVLYTGDEWSIARAGNALYGDYDSTHVNLGVACVTGGSGVGKYATVGGGFQNTAGASSSTIGGGRENTASQPWSTISGGWNNTASWSMATIGGGEHNTASGGHATVGGGYGNTASGDDPMMGGYTTVGGGEQNTASGGHATVGGGSGNTASEMNATVGGGSYNTAGGGAFVGGGDQNNASGYVSTIGGGWANTASGYLGTIPGGSHNTARGERSFAIGSLAKANHDGSVCLVANHLTALVDSVRTGGAEQMVLRADGGLYLTNTAELVPYDPTNIITTRGGAYLSGNGTAWTNASDRNKKENFTALDREELLARIAALPITRWNYKNETDEVTHIGPVAQDFHALFGVGGDDKSISTIDPAGIALAAIQELYKKTQKIEELEARMAELQALVEQLLAERQ